MRLPVLLQLPPTPTPYPTPDELPIVMPDQSLWDYTDQAIQTWNSAQQLAVIFQAIMLLGVIIFISMMIYRYAKIITVVRND